MLTIDVRAYLSHVAAPFTGIATDLEVITLPAGGTQAAVPGDEKRPG